MATGGHFTVRKTGGEIDDMVWALIEAAYDKDKAVRKQVTASLHEVGKKQPCLMLSSCQFYLNEHSKLAHGHRVIILNAMEGVFRDCLENIDKQLVVEIVEQVSAEMSQTKEVVPEWQTAASNVLVAIGRSFCNEVMENLLQKFQPGVLPHFFVVQTMGHLSSENVFGMVPFIKVIMGSMLPMLGMSKQDNMRWVFSFALSKFCESILDYVANIEKAPDTSVTKEAFSTEVDSAFDVLFNVWIQSKETKLQLTIVEALGHMSHVMSSEKLHRELQKLIPGVITLHKKHQETYHITVGLCMMLEAYTVDGCTILEPYIDNLLLLLFPQVYQPIDYNNAITIKNQNEVLRCFAVLNCNFSDKIISYMLDRLNQPQEKIKLAALMIIRHLVNSGGDHMEEKKSLVLSGLKLVLGDNNNKVKKILAQVIIAMAHHGYLQLEGGQLMIQFIVRQCALPDVQSKQSNDPDNISNAALRSMCENVLQFLATTVENMDDVLWPSLLEYLVPKQYMDAVGCLCKNAAVIVDRKRKSGSFENQIDFDNLANIPRPCAIISRALVLAGLPKHGNERGIHVLHFMKSLSSVLHEDLVNIWDSVIPKLAKKLEDAEEEEDCDWSQKNWEDLLLKMLSKSLDQVGEEEWFIELGNEMAAQIPLYDKYPDEKNFLYKCMGVVMRKSGKTDFVNRMLDIIFQNTKHTSQIEREGFAIAVGYAAASHIDIVLAKLETMGHFDSGKKSSGLFGFLKDSVGMKGEIEELTKATIILSYGYVTLFGPCELIASRLEATVMRKLIPQFASVKDPVLKYNLIKTVGLIATAMHPDHLQSSHVFSYKNELLTHMENYLKAENPLELHNDTRSAILDSCTSLVRLDPVLTDIEAHNLLKYSLLSVMSLPVDASQSKKGKEESYKELLVHSRLISSTVESLQNMLHEIIIKNRSSQGVLNVMEHMLPWMSATQEIERERAMVLICSILKLYLENVLPLMGNATEFETMGSILGKLVPRCTDPYVIVRKLAIDGIQTVFKISDKCEGVVESSKMIEALPTLKERLEKTDPNALFTVGKDLSKVICKKTSHSQLIPLITSLTAGLSDQHAHSSSGVCVVLNGVLKPRGGELSTQVDGLFHEIYQTLESITNQQTRKGALRSIRTLAMHHFIPVLTLVLNQRLPYTQDASDCWAVFAQEKELTNQILEYILNTLQRSLPYEEKTDSSSFMSKENTTKVATLLPISVICALTEIFQAEETEELCKELYPRLMSALLVYIASTVGTKPPRITQEELDKKTGKKTGKKINRDLGLDPCQVAIEAFKNCLTCAKEKEMYDVLEEQNVWAILKDEDQYPEAFKLIASCMCETQPEIIPKVVSALNPVMSSPYEPQRIMTAAFFAELINKQCCNDLTLLEMLVNTLLGKLVDTSLHVRKYCIRGLGNVACAGFDQVQKFSTTVVSAMMAGMDDKDDMEDEITLEAMNGLSKILEEIDEEHIRAILINIALRIRPCFEKEKTTVRTSSFKLFGNLARFGDGPSKDTFVEQIHSNLVSILLHLNDVDPDVRKACKTTLKQLGPLLGSESLNSMFQKHLIDTAGLLYGEFMNDLSKILVESFKHKLNFYVMGCVTFYKSNWAEIKSNAAMFSGFLVGNASEDLYGSISKEHVCHALILLLQDPSPEVRIRASEAIGLLYSI